MVAGGDTFINDMMDYCGFENIFSHIETISAISFDDIKEKNTELILLSSEPYPFKEKHKEEIQNELPDIKIKLADGEMFSWYGSRLLKSVDYFQTISSKYVSNSIVIIILFYLNMLLKLVIPYFCKN